MRAAFPLLLAIALSPSAAAAKGPAQLCPHLVRDYARKADLPAGARAVLPAMAERGGRFNVSDAIGPDDRNLPFNRFISARLSGCTPGRRDASASGCIGAVVTRVIRHGRQAGPKERARDGASSHK